jgi:hypothetical protein
VVCWIVVVAEEMRKILVMRTNRWQLVWIYLKIGKGVGRGWIKALPQLGVRVDWNAGRERSLALREITCGSMNEGMGG